MRARSRTVAPHPIPCKADLAVEADGVIGLDIAGYEPSAPLTPELLTILKVAKTKAAGSLGITVHAGEWPGTVAMATGEVETVRNLRAAVDSGVVDRIGHGIQMAGNEPLITATKLRGIHIECQPFSNIAHIPTLETHPTGEFARKGLSVSLNCDNLMFSGDAAHPHDGGPSLQLACLKSKLSMEWDEIADMTQQACNHLFGVTEADRAALKARIAQGFAAARAVGP
jgi:adenosine deaminase